jgi:Tfp pilus assembly protein PilX
MKTAIIRRARELGASLLTVLSICTVISLGVAGYLTLITQQSRMSARSQVWNMAIAVSEAGVEEGLQKLNSSTNLNAADGWTASGPMYSLTRTLPDGNSYTVEIDNSSPNTPTITSRAVIDYSNIAQNAPTVFLATAGAPSLNQPITRAVKVKTIRSNMLLGSMVAKKSIDLNGQGILSNSFDSGDPAKSTNGHYDPSKVGDKGDVASNEGIVGIISVGNATIYGHVHTGPGGTADLGSQGAVGPIGWTGPGIAPGWATEDANFTFPDTTAPYSSGPGLPAGGDVTSAVGSTNPPTYVNGSATYPGAAPSGYTMSTITTNFTSVTVSAYPGATSGMTTNTTYTSTTNNPGALPGLTVACSSFTTVSSYPGAQPCLSTNSSSITVQNDPGPKPGLIINYKGNGNSKTIASYTYTVYNYTYGSGLTYTYPTYTYTHSTLSYSYVLYESGTTYTTTTYDHILTSGDYYATSLSGSVYVSGQARLVLPNGLNMSGGDKFVLGPSGSISLYPGGTETTISGNGVVNPSGFAGNFMVYCSTNVTKIALNGNGEFIGVLVAPNANLTLNGGGNADEDFIGAVMANSVKMNGHFKFHYDEALGRLPATGRFLITSWDEIN